MLNTKNCQEHKSEVSLVLSMFFNILTQHKWVTQTHKTSSRFFPLLYENKEEEKQKCSRTQKPQASHRCINTFIIL